MNGLTLKSLRLPLAALVAVAVVAAVLVPVSSGRSAPRTVVSAKASLSVFKKPFRANRAQVRARAELRREFRHGRTAIASAAFGDARPVPVVGSDAEVWLAPAADGGVCTFIPDPQGGYGASCASPQQINAGHAISALGGGSAGPLSGAAIVAVVEPDGAAAPSVRGAGGALRALAIQDNVAAAVVGLGDTIVSGLNTVTIPDPRTLGDCAPARDGESFKRCG